MNHPETTVGNERNAQAKIIDLIIRLVAIALLLYWCFLVLEPFFSLLLWASVLAISLYPSFKALKQRLRDKNALAATLITIVLLIVLIGPAVWMIISTGGELRSLAQSLATEHIAIPPPAEKIQEIPVIGKQVHDIWLLAATNLQEVVLEYEDQIKAIGAKIIGMIASAAKGVLLLAAAIIISGVLLAYATALGKFADLFFVRLAGSKGSELASMAESTVRNVTRGILGVAFIQAILAGIGMFVAGIPYAGLWMIVSLMLAIVQVSILPVSVGVIIYAWSSLGTTAAVLITIWMLFVGLLDNVLKPILLGKGATVPMLVVFLGAIGGFIHSGFIGLFTGAIMLSLGYKLFTGWISANGNDQA